METKLIIVADLGLLRAYRPTQSTKDQQPHLKLIAELKPLAAHEKLSDQVSDQAGRFPSGGGAAGVSGDLSSGEQLQQETEQDHRLIKIMADKINALLADKEVTHCLVAISAPIHKQLLDGLEPGVRKKIHQVLSSNLTKTDPNELLEHFEKANRVST